MRDCTFPNYLPPWQGGLTGGSSLAPRQSMFALVWRTHLALACLWKLSGNHSHLVWLPTRPCSPGWKSECLLQKCSSGRSSTVHPSVLFASLRASGLARSPRSCLSVSASLDCRWYRQRWWGHRCRDHWNCRLGGPSRSSSHRSTLFYNSFRCHHLSMLNSLLFLHPCPPSAYKLL